MKPQQIPEWKSQVDEIWKLFKERDREIEELNSLFKESREQIMTTDKKVNSIEDNWGKLMEALVEGDALDVFNKIGLVLHSVTPNRKYSPNNNFLDETEFDLILSGKDEVVVIETKTSLSAKKVDHFLNKLSKFKEYFPEYSNFQIYGAVASLKFYSEADKYAYRKKLYVLKVTGKGLIKILNDKKFKPKSF